jgi:isopentenyl diphosphate isomerase/L-lactate dehydrogenase-like FMN-dependent dehydrogenase
LVITVDAPTVGLRRRDILAQIEAHRLKQEVVDIAAASVAAGRGSDVGTGTGGGDGNAAGAGDGNASSTSGGGGGGRSSAGSRFLGSAPRSGGSGWDTGLCWEDLCWFKSVTALPIVLKGVLRADDAVRAARIGVAAIVVSNHGGRNLDGARPTLVALAHIMLALNNHGLACAIEVYMDGGVRHGADVYKALALGARAVGVGRPVLYSLASHGSTGVRSSSSFLLCQINAMLHLSR